MNGCTERSGGIRPAVPVMAVLVIAGVDGFAVQSYMFGQSPTTVDYECSGR